MTEQRVFYKVKVESWCVGGGRGGGRASRGGGWWETYHKCRFDEYIDAEDWAQRRIKDWPAGFILRYHIWYVVQEKHLMTEWIDA